MSNEELFNLGLDIVCEILKIEIMKSDHVKKKRLWVRNWIKKRQTLGLSATLLKEVRVKDRKTYKNHLRMSPEKFDELLSLVKNDIFKKDTHFREAIPASIKLQITLRYLASGDSFSSLEHAYRVPKSSISVFLIPMLKAISTKLKDVIKTPCAENEWKKVCQGFSHRWNFPKCCGAIDGKHIRIKCPPCSNSDYINYKGFFSTILFAVVDSNYKFVYIDIGKNGRVNDSTIFRDSAFKKNIEDGTIHYPKWGVLVGDDAFPLSTYLMKPYSHHGLLSKEERIFNYRLSRARRVVENAFGILAPRFRIFTRPIDLKPEKVDEIVKTSCHLHNWLRTTDCNSYFPSGCVDSEDLDSGRITAGQWRAEVGDNFLRSVSAYSSANNYSRDASLRRQKYKEYFMSVGAVEWQFKVVQ